MGNQGESHPWVPSERGLAATLKWEIGWAIKNVANVPSIVHVIRTCVEELPTCISKKDS